MKGVPPHFGKNWRRPFAIMSCIVVCGDFNARVGSALNDMDAGFKEAFPHVHCSFDKVINNRGRKFIEIMQRA